LYYGGTNTFWHLGGGTWRMYDVLFDKTGLSQTGALTHDYNGYLSGADRLSPNGGHDVILTTDPLDYQVGPLGWSYYPSSGGGGGLSDLLDAGSVSAPSVGLYQYTVRIDLAKEGNSQVDIGYHYIATDANGNPIDTDGDGLPDYEEDANGNGLLDSGETDWNDANDAGLRVVILQPRDGEVIP